MNKRHALRWISAGTVAAAAGLLGACSDTKASFHGVDITGAEYARDFPLEDPQGKPRRLQEFVGKVVVVFFGYTQCPDVCPTTLQELAEVRQSLGADADRLQGIFITVDPERDTPEILQAYMSSFDPSFIALRGSTDQLAAVAKDFKIYYKKVEGKTPTSYTMDHSAGSYIYDPAGRLRVYHRYGSGTPALAADVKTLLQERPR